MSEVQDDDDQLEAAANDPVPDVNHLCPRTQVAPLISIARPKVALVVKPYTGATPRRLAVRLSTTSGFTGTGTLDCDPGGDVVMYRTEQGGAAVGLPWQNIPGAQLTRGITVYVEAAQPSQGLNQTELSLSIAYAEDDPPKDILHNPALDQMTCVEVTLDLCEYKPAPGGGDPNPMAAHKFNVGRNIHLQTRGRWAGRAMMIVQQAQPADYAGRLVLKRRNNRVQAFPYANEVAAQGQAAVNTTLRIDNATLNVPLRLWVEGASVSGAVRDTGYTLGISDVPDIVGDQVNVTVVKAVLDIYDMPHRPGDDQRRIGSGDKLNRGRSLHMQDGGTHFGRAKVVVKDVEPAGWAGDLEVQIWDVTANDAVLQRVALFEGQPANAAAHAPPIACPADVPLAGKELWAQGAVISGAMRDTQLRLRVTDAEGSIDRAAVTVHDFYVREITFDGIRPIYYARIPTAGSYILPDAANGLALHISPPAARPAGNGPHWRRQAGQNVNAQFSWPAVYVRRGGQGAPTPNLRASFELFPQPGDDVTVPIHAQMAGGQMRLRPQDVTFTNGVSQPVQFRIEQMPDTVARLDGMDFQWYFDGWGPQTHHTLFMVNKKPRAADHAYLVGGNVVRGDAYLWEIFEWSCAWANGVNGRDNVFAAIWGQFNPVQLPPSHITGLVYWKNHNDPLNPIAPAQDLPSAIQSQDDADPDQQNAASCIVFDRVLINCCAAHGMRATEVVIAAPGGASPFAYLGHQVGAVRWHDTTVDGQGNDDAPEYWRNHWIATIRLGAWRYYDASYGAGPVNAPGPPLLGSSIDPFIFEPLTVQSWDCRDMNTSVPVLPERPRQVNRGTPPHLIGRILWKNG